MFSTPAVGTLIGLADAVAIFVLFSRVSLLESRLEQHTSETMISGSSDHAKTEGFPSRPLIESFPSAGSQGMPMAPILKDALSRISALERGLASVLKRTDDLQTAVMTLAHHMRQLSAASNSPKETMVSPRSLITSTASPVSTAPVESPDSRKRPNAPPTEEESLVELGWGA